MSLADIVSVTVFLSEPIQIELQDRFNEVYNTFFKNAPFPVRATVGANLPFKALVEVEVIARKD